MTSFTPLPACFAMSDFASRVLILKSSVFFPSGFTFMIRPTCHAAWFAITEASQKVASSISSDAIIRKSGARKANST